MMLNRKTRAAVAALGILAGSLAGGIAAAGPAAAASSGCASSSVFPQLSWNFYDSSGHLAAIGYLQQYNNGACAELIAQGAYSGEDKWMEVNINNGSGVIYKQDANFYYYYAGPITISPGNGDCLWAHFQMSDSSGNQILNYTNAHTACG